MSVDKQKSGSFIQTCSHIYRLFCLFNLISFLVFVRVSIFSALFRCLFLQIPWLSNFQTPLAILLRQQRCRCVRGGLLGQSSLRRGQGGTVVRPGRRQTPQHRPRRPSQQAGHARGCHRGGGHQRPGSAQAEVQVVRPGLLRRQRGRAH